MYARFDRSAARFRVAGTQRGVMLIELIVIMIIIALLIALLAPRFRATRTTRIKAAISTAQTYADAVNAFMLDHGGLVPVGAEFEKPQGPFHYLGKTSGKTYYLRRGIPESISSGAIKWDDKKAGLVYVGSGDRYRIEVWVFDKYVCSVGNDPQGGPDEQTCQ